MFSLATRSRVAELMDDPTIDVDSHRRALRGLARLNRLSMPDRALWAAIARALPGRSTLRLLDLACGSGDVSVALQRRARRHGVDLEVVCVDASETAVHAARDHARKAGATITVERGDALSARHSGSFDVVMCSLFLHHLDRPQALNLVRNMAIAARHLVLVEDLARGGAGLALAASVPRVVTRSAIVHEDARRSVRAAFTPREAAALAIDAGLRSVRVRRHWPARYLLAGSP